MCISLILERNPQLLLRKLQIYILWTAIVIHIRQNNQQDTHFFSLIYSN